MNDNHNHDNQTFYRMPWTPVDKVMELLSVMGVIVSIYIIISSWPMLPDEIPGRFNFTGEVVSPTGKESLIAILIATILVYLTFSLISRYPKSWMLPWKITEKNAKKQYQVVKKMLIAIKSFVVLILTYITWSMVNIAMGNAEVLGAWFLPVVLIVLALIIGTSLFKLYQHR